MLILKHPENTNNDPSIRFDLYSSSMGCCCKEKSGKVSTPGRAAQSNALSQALADAAAQDAQAAEALSKRRF